MPNNKNDFKPYIPADRVVPEFTVTSILIGVLLAIIFVLPTHTSVCASV